MYGADRLKEWERQQRLLAQKRQQWQANEKRVASLRVQSNKPAPKQSFFNKVRDTFDANTEADQYRRQQAGKAKLYAQEQKDMGRTRISNNPFQRGTNTFRSLAETIKQPYEGLGKGISTAFGEGASLRDYEAKTQQENLAHVENLRKQLAKPTTSLADRAALRSRIGIASTAAQNSYNRQIAQTQQLERDADPRKQAGNIIQIGTDLAGLGVAGFAGKKFGKDVAQLGWKQASARALPAIGQNAAINTIQGGSGELQSDDPTMAGALRKAALGGAIGTVADLTLGGFAALPSNRAYKNVVKELADETDGAVVRDTVKEIANDLPEETIDDISKQITKATDEATVDQIIRQAALDEGKITAPIRKTFEPLEQVPTTGTATKDPSIIYGFKQAKTPEQARDSVKVLFPELDDKAVNKASQDLAKATDDNTVNQVLERTQAQREAVTQGVDKATPTGEIAPTPEQQLAEVAQEQPTAPVTSQQPVNADTQANQVIAPDAPTAQAPTVPGVNRVTEVPGSNQVESDRIADALGIPKADRTPTADAQVAGRVEMAMAKGLSGDMTPQQIKAELRARNGNKPTTARSLKEKPAKQTFEQVTKEYQGNTGAARIDRQSTIADLQKRYKLSKEEKLNAILAIDDPSVQPISDQVAQLTQEYKQLTDSAYRAYTGAGIDMGYVESYLPRIYKNPETGQMIDRAEYELLQQGTSRVKGREADKVATDWLVEKDPVKLLERYYDSMDRTVAGKAYLSKLEDNGLVVASTDMVPGLRPVVAEGLQAGNGMVYYANKDVANKLNTLFGSKESNNIVEAALDKAKGVNSLFQSVILSGGIPNTPLNAFGVMQVLKETMALHPYKAGKALIAGLSKDFANNLFTKKKDILKLMAENDIDVRVDLTQTGKYGRERTKDAFKDQGVTGGINQAWNEFTNDSTFGRFMPALEVLHFENIYKAARGRGASIADASALAAESTKNFYGKTSVFKQSVRSKAVDDAAGAFLFAPRFRESMLNFWGKNAQAAIPTNWGKVAYRDNQKFLAASAATFAAMTSLNESLNGVQMWDNPDGKKDKLIIPAAALDKLGINTNGKDVAIPFLPSLSTVPRNIGMGAYNFAVGNDEEGWKNVKSFASIPISLGMDVATNEDYFGSKIVEDGTPALDKRVQQGTYLLKNAMQPWIREGLNIAGQKLPENVKAKLGIKEKSGVESASNALELPFRFYNPKYYNYDKQFVPGGKEGEKFTFAEQRDRAKIGKEIKGIPDSLGLNKRQKAAYAKLNAVEFNDDGTLKEDSNPFYKVQRYSDLQDDKVFEAVKQRAKLNAKLNGKPIDPIFSESVAPEQRRVLLWKKTLPPGTSDPTVKKLYEQDWYLDYQNKERAYYDQKKAWNKEMGYKEPPQSTNPYPEASPELQKSMDFYFTLPKGTGARSSWIKGNGGVWNQMINYWESKDAWTNGERAKVGLGNVDDEKSGGSGGGKFGYSKGGKSGSGGGGSGKGAKLKTPKTYITELLGNVPNISSDEIAIRTAPKRAKFKVKTPSGKGRNYKKIKLN